MDTRQLKTLVAIATRGTFTKAAEIVNLTPSAVSQQIQALEVELNITLFERSFRPPKLTSQGLQVLEMAQEMLRLEDDTKANLRGDKLAGTLMLGSVRSSALNLLPRAIVQMRNQYPDLKTNLRVSLSSTLIADVASGRLDAAVVAEHVGIPPALRWSPFLREPLWLIAPEDTKSTDPADLLATCPFIRFRSAVPLANLIDTEISRMGIATNDIAEIDTIGSIVTCVRQGMGVSVVPHVALQEPDHQRLTKLPFGNPQVTRQIGIVERIVSPRAEIIARIHTVLAELCAPHGVSRIEDVS
ncbi:HTH-type transcriptional regulator YofA [Labrenzia sp. THAF191b]|uniref:LysR family transcriptional regulator n=1 Tax=unclassified Labrenzia TaxID=2648686 RepID=UPI001268243C|nr:MULTISPECIES: LysR family transcriptional regulator [unclassified Labrenzia]QFT01164.1 HTH-type transcriptional regulator YofA [Labrenzia sp. THAF191b]QFT07477.1 HTH-type transcriptional regulator YofA [Labrenzia sp. THAF191a]QFT19021.1 HTH-type transcriptional regulator YofA [Labrenzia sp. THAF187b]